MDETYLLYSPRGQGWFTPSSTYNSDIAQAKRMPREDAIAMVKKHRTDAGHNMLPIRLSDMEAL